MANVKFYRGDKKGYSFLSATDRANAIYFAIDTQELIHNGIAYGRDADMSAVFEVLEGQRDEIRNHDTEIDAINTSLDGLTQVVSGIKTTVSSHTTSINKLTKTTVPALQQDIDAASANAFAAKNAVQEAMKLLEEGALFMSRMNTVWPVQDTLEIPTVDRHVSLSAKEIDDIFGMNNGKLEIYTKDQNNTPIPVASIKVSRLVNEDVPVRYITVDSLYATYISQGDIAFNIEDLPMNPIFGFAIMEVGTETFNEMG